MAQGWTPIFEWCSRKQRIVIDYPEDRLVLTAMRNNATGEYLSYDALVEAGEAHGVHVLKAGPPTKGFVPERLVHLRDLEGEEGEVWRFDDGHMVKVKGEWYLQLHRTLDHLRWEKDVIRLILDEKLDDAKPFLPEDLVSAADDFAKQIFEGLRKFASDIHWEAQADFDNFNGGKKKFAERVMSERKDMSKFLFVAWDSLEDGEEGMFKYMLEYVYNNLGTQTKVNAMRHLWGGKCWYDYRDAPVEE